MSEVVNIDYLLNTEQFAASSKKVEASISGTERVCTSATRSMDNSYRRAAVGVGVFAGAVTAAAAARELYEFANNFANAMTEVSTISGTVAADMIYFKESILDMTTTVPVAADAAAKAYYQVVSAGHDGAAGLQILETSAKAAIGGMTDTVTAADAITTLLNAYKQDASEANAVSDMLFTTAKLGKTTFGELGRSISQAAPIAASFGIEMDQVLAAVATLTKSGTPTAQAMTQIRAAILSASKELGDGYFATHTFQEGLAEIARRADGSEAKLRTLVTETEAINGILGLTGINAKTAADDLSAMARSTGEAEAAFKKMSERADAQLTILKNNVLKKLYGIGEDANSAMASIAKALNEAFATGSIDTFVKVLASLIAMYGTYKATLLVVQGIEASGRVVKMVYEYLQMGKALGFATANQMMFNRAALMNPYTAVAAALAVLVGGLILFNKESETARDIIDSLNDATAAYGSSINSLDKDISRYEALQAKASTSAGLSEVEHKELNTIMERMLITVPNLRGTFDEYSAALSVNIDRVKEYSAEQKAAFRDVLVANIAAAEESKKKLAEQMDAQRRMFQPESVPMQPQKVVRFGNRVKYEKRGYTIASPEEMAEARREWLKLKKDYDDTVNSIAEAQNTLAGVKKSIAADNVPPCPTCGKKPCECQKEIAKNKAYWDEIKKTAETARDAMGADKAGTKEWGELSATIAEANRNLAKYKTDGEAAGSPGTISAIDTEIKRLKELQDQRATTHEQWQKIQSEIDLLEHSKQQVIDPAGSRQWLDDFAKELRQKKAAATVEVDTTIAADVFAKEKASWEDYYTQYGTFGQKRVALIEKYNRLIAEAETGGEKASLSAEYDKALESLSRNAVETSEVWKSLFQNLGNVSTESLKSIYAAASDEITKASDLTATDIKDLQDRLKAVHDELIARNPFKELKKAYDAYKKAIKAGDKDGAQALWGDVKVATGQIRKHVQTVGGDLSKLGKVFSSDVSGGIDNVLSMTDNALTAFESLGKSGEKSTDDIVNGISGIIGVLTTMLGLVVGMFDNEAAERAAYAEKIRQLEGYWDSVNFQVERYVELLEQASGQNYLDYIAKSVKALEDGLERAKKALHYWDSDSQSEGVFAALINEVNTVSASVVEAFGQGEQFREAAALLKDFSYDSLIALKSNADVWGVLSDRLRDLVTQAIDYYEKMEEIATHAKENMLQTSTSEMESAMVEWLKNTKDGIDDIGKQFEEVMRDALLNSFVMDKLRPKIKAFYDKYNELADSDGDGKLDLTAEEMAALRNDWAAMAEWAKGETEALRDIFGGGSDADSLAGQIRGTIATEQSVSELAGIMRRDSDNISGTRSAVDLGLKDLAVMLRTILAIEVNTRNTAGNTAAIATAVVANGKKLDKLITNTQQDYGTY